MAQQRRNRLFTRENTKEIKGIAVLLMLAHHLYTFADRIPYGMEVATSITVSNQELTVIIGSFGKICVSLFMFLGGYGLFAARAGDEKHIKCLTNDVVRLYLSYWKVFLVFIPVGFLFFSRQPQYAAADLCQRFANLSWNEVIANFIGWSCSLNGEWWFFKSYLFTLFEGYFFLEIFKDKQNVYLECAAAVAWHILIAGVFPAIAASESWQGLAYNVWYSNLLQITDYAQVFFVGSIFAKYKIFEAWGNRFAHLKRLEKIGGGLAVVMVTVYTRVFLVPPSFDMILAPVFVFACMALMDEVRVLRVPLRIIGENSTNMWLIHSFYCYYFYAFARLVYGSGNAVVSFVVLVVLSFVSGVLLDRFWKILCIIKFLIIK